MKKFLFRTFFVLLSLGLLLAGWITFDLYAPHQIDLRKFDPDEVARLDTAMWRSYYEKERLRMFSELGELLSRQYKLRFWRRQLVALYAARAAFIFKEGKSRTDYEQALPYLEKFFSEIRDISSTDFDTQKAAARELEWWIIHRERKKHQEGDLAKALAETAATIYKMPCSNFIEHGELRAEAMKIRDTKAAAGGVTEKDWKKIDELLHKSWRSLHNAVNQK